jgi:signal transduction histidine kinase/ligand-binding sensor domain-containing protein
MNRGGTRIFAVMHLALVCLVWVWGGPQTALAQTVNRRDTKYLQRVWRTEDGLPQNSVTSIVQTRDGYLWLGTFGGLARFDGVKFTIFDATNSPGLKSNRIVTLYEDRKSHLWIGTEDGGLAQYAQGRFTTYTTEDGLPSNLVWSIGEDRDGTLWIGTENGGLTRYAHGRFTVYGDKADFPTSKVIGAQPGPDGSLWFVSDRTLMRFDGSKMTTTTIIGDGPGRILNHCVGPDGSLWIATTRGLFQYRAARLMAVTRHLLSSPQDVRSDLVLRVFKNREGDIRFLTPQGVARFEGGRLVMEREIAELSRLMDEIPRLRSLLVDREGNLWMGTDGKGLHRFKPGPLTAYTQADGLSDNSFVPVMEDADGTLWLGSTSGGLFQFQHGTFSAHNLYAYNIAGRRTLIGPWALERARTGGLWIGDYLGLHRYREGHVTSLKRFVDIPVMALYEDRDGVLWIGTLTSNTPGNPGGLHRLNHEETTHYGVEDGLVANDVRVITPDRHGALWIGTTGGLSRFKDGRFTNYTTAHGLSHDYVRDIYEDADGTLWIGTYGGGLNRFKNGIFTHITTKNGLFDNIVSRILEDDRGHFWMSCNRGIYRVSRRELNDFVDGKIQAVSSISYGVGDGMATSECNGGAQPAGWKTRDGKLWFPTIKGVAVVDPSRVNPLPPPVYIEQVVIDGIHYVQSAIRNPQSAIDGISVDLGQPIEIAPDQKDFEIHYTGLCFTAPEKVRFKYQLEGYDGHWVDAGQRRTAYFTSLPPGEYRFRVIAANNDGVWNMEGASLRFVLLPPFWQTWWFLSLTIVGIGGLTALVYHQRVSQLKRATAAQEEFSRRLIESQENDRKRIASELHDSLSQSLVIIKNRALHSLQTPEKPELAFEQMEEIAESASQALTEVRQMAYDLRPFQIDRLGLTKAIEAMVKKVADSNELRITTDLASIDGLLPPALEIHLYRIVQEGLNNIIKHAEATEANVTIKKDSPAMEMTIQDNGKGFNPDLATHDRSGFGWIGMTERARILGASLLLQSAPGKGTTVTVRVELKDGRYVR